MFKLEGRTENLNDLAARKLIYITRSVQPFGQEAK